MDIEEAKKKIKEYIHDWCDSWTDEDGYETSIVTEDSKEFVEAIETVLQELEKKDKLYQMALEDSIKTSKQIIEIKKILQENLRKDIKNEI